MSASTPPAIETSKSDLLTASPSTQPNTNPLEAKKIAALEAKITALQTQIKETDEKRREIDGKLKSADPQATVKAHIKLLHDYNEIRDIGQGLMGVIADTKGLRVRDVYRDFDVGAAD